MKRSCPVIFFWLLAVPLLVGGCSSFDPDSGAYLGTKNLGLVLLQEGMEAKPDETGRGIVRYTVKMKPFVLLVPKAAGRTASTQGADASIRVCAASDDRIFEQLDSRPKIADLPCFRPGTGMAPGADEHARGMRLTVSSGDAHNYFSPERRVDGKRYSAVFIREMVNRKGEPIGSGNVYVIVLADRNNDGFAAEADQERIVLLQDP